MVELDNKLMVRSDRIWCLSMIIVLVICLVVGVEHDECCDQL